MVESGQSNGSKWSDDEAQVFWMNSTMSAASRDAEMNQSL